MSDRSSNSNELSRLLTAFGIIGWLAIVIMSVLPGSARPHSGAGGFSEHFVAYAIVAFCLTWSSASWRKRTILLLGLVLTSGVLELVQLYIPGRTAELKGLWSAAAGSLAGLALTMLQGFRRRAS